MTLKKAGIVLFLIFSLLPVSEISAQTSNIGFVSGNIWYSKDPFEEGEKIKIYTFVFNPDSRELSGTVIFFDKTVLLGKKNFVIPGKTAEGVSIDWTVNAGDHVIFGKIENAKFLISTGKYEEVYLTENETERSSRTVSKKITYKLTDTNNTDSVSTSVSDITKMIEEKTPDFITKPIVSTTNKLEEFRESIITISENKKEKVKNEIKVLNNPVTETKLQKGSSTPKETVSPLLKPFKYVELFFLSVFSYILNNKILFYGILVIMVFFILRYIWKKIF